MENVVVSIIVVTANSGDILLDCIARVLASVMPIELIVSDNASHDGSIERLENRYAQETRLHIVKNNQNLGFGAAVNRAAKLSMGHHLLILNPDCLIEPDMLEQLTVVASQYSDAGLLGVSVCDALGMVDPASRRREPLLRRAVMTLLGLAHFEAYSSHFAGVNIPGALANSVEKVEAIAGALMWVRRDVFDQVGGFDEGYFLHGEDLDLCRRIRDAGYSVLYLSHLRAFHAKGGSSKHRPVFVSFHKHRGMWRYFHKFDPAARNPLIRAAVWSGIWLHFALTLPFRIAAIYSR